MFSLFQMILLFRLRYVFADHQNQVYLIWEQKYHQWEDIAKRMICFDLKKPISKVCLTWSYLVVYLVALEKTFTKTNAKNYNCTHEKKDKMNGYRQCLLFSVRESVQIRSFFKTVFFRLRTEYGDFTERILVFSLNTEKQGPQKTRYS